MFFVILWQVKLEEQKKRREDAETESEELKTELKKAILDMEQLIREKVYYSSSTQVFSARPSLRFSSVIQFFF